MDNRQLNQDKDDVTSDPLESLVQDKKPASAGRAIALLALLLALTAIGATGWQWWQAQLSDPDESTQAASITRLQESQQQLTNSIATLKNQLDSAETPVDAAQVAGLDKRLGDVENQLGSLQGAQGQEQASINAMQGSVRSLEQRLSTVESGLVSVAASSQNSSEELDIAEIDFILRAASERLQLFSDISAADLALQAADVQIEALDDPMFLSVRQRIAAARQALAAVPRVDRVELSAQLTAMQSRVPDLPFRGEVAAAPPPELADDAGWWESFKHTMSSLVTVKRRVPDDQSMLSLEDKDYLRQGLWLQFESARLALMRYDTGVYMGSLERVNETVEQFFYNGSSQVQALLEELAALKQVNIAPEMPDISAPWTQLRQLRDSRRLLQSAAPLESGDSIE